MNAITTLCFSNQIDKQVVNPNNLPETPLDTSKTTNGPEKNLSQTTNQIPIQILLLLK